MSSSRGHTISHRFIRLEYLYFIVQKHCLNVVAILCFSNAISVGFRPAYYFPQFVPSQARITTVTETLT